MFDKIKGIMEMQKKMQEMKRQLDLMTFEIQSQDKLISITMNGSQEIHQVKINPSAQSQKPEVLEQGIKDTLNRAIKRSHELAAQKMKDVTGLNLPGI
jgi:hypothetical protein